jgi:hypothetical protein
MQRRASRLLRGRVLLYLLGKTDTETAFCNRLPYFVTVFHASVEP